MKLEHFPYLLEVNRLHSISAAARSLHIRQTTLSAIVKAAEEELGFSIFQRAPTGVAATPMGEQFMALAWEINVKCEELFSLKQRTSDGSQAITLLLAPTIASVLPIRLTQRYHEFEVRGNLTFEECLSTELFDRLAENTANIGVAYLTEQELSRIQKDAKEHSIIIDRLLEDQIYLLVSREHPFSQLDEVSVDMMQGQRLATAKKTIRNDAILGMAMLACPRFTTFSDISVMMRAVLEQNMVAFLPRYTILAMGEPLSAYRVLPVHGTERENRLYLCLIHRQESALRYQEKILTSCIREHFYDFLGRHPEFTVRTEGGTPV